MVRVFTCHGLGACPSLPFHLYRFGFPGVPFVPSSPSFLDLFFPSPLSRTSSTEAGPTGPNQEQQDRTRANRINRTEPGPTGPDQDKQDRARPNRTNQDKQDRTRTLGGLRGRFGKVWDASWSVLGRVLARLERASFWSVLGTSRVVSRRLESVLGAS